MKLLWTILFLVCCLPLNGQSVKDIITKVDKDQYAYQDSIYSKHELFSLMQSNPTALEKYNIGINGLKKGKTFGYTTLAALGVGVISIAVNSSDAAKCDNCIASGLIIGVISIGLVAPITGSYALLKHFGGKGKLKSSIEEFNSDKDYDSMGRLIEQPQLQLANHGLGLTVVF